MSNARKEYFLLIAGLILLAVTAAAVYYIQRAPNRTRDMAQVSQLVQSFGAYEKSISLQADTELLKSDIQQNYSQFVTDALLQQWRADPKNAPGRLTSSPWPDRIEIDSVSPQGAGYIVSGRIVMMTSTGVSGEVPVVLLVMREKDTWKIAVYQEGTASTSTKE
jgi:hypothetical protein